MGTAMDKESQVHESNKQKEGRKSIKLSWLPPATQPEAKNKRQ